MKNSGQPRGRGSAKAGNIISFKSIKKTSIPDEIIDQILSMLVTGELSPGDRLPSEKQLCELFNVGRSSVREALKTLENQGVVRRSTTGTIVCRPEETHYPSFSLAVSGATLEQIFEFSRIVAIEAAGLAAERATRKQKDKMLKALREFESAREATALHFSFHRALLQSAHNPFLSQAGNIVLGLLSQSEKLSSTVQGWDKEKLRAGIRKMSAGHRKILKAIESKNSTAARRSMREHIRYLEALALEDTDERVAGNVKA